MNTSLNFSRAKMRHEMVYSAVTTDLGANLIYKFNNGYIMKEDARVAPFLSIGFGITNTQRQEFFFDEFDGGVHGMMPYAIGLDFKVTDQMAVTTSATYINTLDDTFQYLQFGVVAKFSLKTYKDKDGDGVLDRDDVCPNMKGPASNSGCPVEDDREVPVLNPNSMDDDNDGVPNSMDACPQVAGSLNGCPDTDGDSVPDIYDVCPAIAGRPELGGCPDSDNDGIIDSLDPCPTTYGTIRGCTQEAINAMAPDSKETIRIKLIAASENILFNLNSTKLTGDYQKSLNDVLQILKDNPTLSVHINGHADSQGSLEHNKTLSRQRAYVVKQWFIDKGIPASRLESKSFGELVPRGTNDTAIGRALNRRVHIDFIVLNK